ncbi:uncharacterized protein LOC118189565 isoform X2 [Stegodyphus dumicola]|nr:uncharacterized protein LOC118189565 isoform X2 [Stegodyphus dumicola]
MLFHSVSATPLPTEGTLRVSELPFSEKLQNPCALVDATRLQGSTLARESEQDRLATRRTVVKELKAKAILLRGSAETILRTNVLQDCSSLELPSVAIIPTADEISSSETKEVLLAFYTSLLNHTAHVYFMSDQMQQHSSDETCNSADLATSAKSLASHMRELMCVLRLCTLALQDEPDEDDDFHFEESTSQILNEQLIDQPLCSRRSVRDCQTVGSTVTLLREFSSYLQKTRLMPDEVLAGS